MFNKETILNDYRSINSLDFSRSSKRTFESLLYQRSNSQNGGIGGSLARYPSDLGLNPEYQVIMQIDIWENDSKVLGTKRESVLVSKGNEALDDIRTNANAEEGKQVDPFSLDGLGNTISSIGKFGLAAGNQLATTALGAVTSANPSGKGTGEFSYTEEQTGLAGRTSFTGKRLYLYLPSGIETKYGFTYESKDMASMGVLQLGKALSESARGNADADALAAELGKQVGMANIKALEKLTEGVGVEEGTLRAYAEASQRQVVNPMTVHLFKSVERREFSFSWTFLPKSRQELANVYEIIHTMKYYAHPRRSTAGRFLDYPAEFLIRFRNYDGSDNQYLPRILRCVAKSVSVKYGEDGVFSTFERDKLGSAPTKIVMSVDFTELEILTQDRFDMQEGTIYSP